VAVVSGMGGEQAAWHEGGDDGTVASCAMHEREKKERN
jgi:hypothetical protein